MSPKAEILKSYMADWLLEMQFGSNSTMDSPILQNFVKRRKIQTQWWSHVENFKFWKYKMADGFAMKRCGMRMLQSFAGGGRLSSRRNGAIHLLFYQCAYGIILSHL